MEGSGTWWARVAGTSLSKGVMEFGILSQALKGLGPALQPQKGGSSVTCPTDHSISRRDNRRHFTDATDLTRGEVATWKAWL